MNEHLVFDELVPVDGPGLRQSYHALDTGPSPESLPSTPEDAEATDCQELELGDTLGPLLPIAKAPPRPWRENPFISVYSPESDMPVLPWIVDGTVLRHQTLNANPRNAPVTKPASSFLGFTNRKKRPVSPDELSTSTPPTKVPKHSDPDTAQESEEQDEIVFGPPHMLQEGHGDEWWCACSKLFSAKSSLERHVQEQSGMQPFVCSHCAKPFARKDVRDRHEKTVHRGGKVPCPCCQKLFRKDWLRQHLASRANTKCQIFVEALQLSACGTQAGAKVADVGKHYWASSAQAWPLSASGRLCPSSTSLFNMRPSPEERSNWEPSLRHRSIPQRPIRRRSEEPCDLCHDRLGVTEAEIVAHHIRHIQDLEVTTHWCNQCGIPFAHEQDLQRHLKAAEDGYCGLNFNHLDTQQPPEARKCTGHHPVGDMRHSAMRICLMNWEMCQLQAHRATIVRILADRLAFTQPSHMSLNEQKLATMRLVRWSIASLRSFDTAPANLQFKDDVDVQTLASGFANLLGSRRSSVQISSRTQVAEEPRPASMTISQDYLRLDTGGQHLNATWQERAPVVQMQADYVNRVRALRSPGLVDNAPSGIRRYAAKASRYLLEPSHVLESRYVRSAAT